jgi:hypothetical protein
MIRGHAHYVADHLGLGRQAAKSFWKSKSPNWGAEELIDFLTRAGIFAAYEPYLDMIKECRTADSAWDMLEFVVRSKKKGWRIDKPSDFLFFLGQNDFINQGEKKAVHDRAVNLVTELGLDLE